ncbi:MAG: hypothetical protein QOJ19_775 [Acidimicrobiia bacterium]|nr:hypothetical protein [Acidimicrobiia bacterium]
MQEAQTERRVRLNETAYEHARRAIAEGKAVIDERDDWSEHQPSSQQENEFIEAHGWTAYARWYLGINEQATERTKARYEFPYGDFENVHRCGVLAAESRAAQYDHADIETAAAHLHGMLDELRASGVSAGS